MGCKSWHSGGARGTKTQGSTRTDRQEERRTLRWERCYRRVVNPEGHRATAGSRAYWSGQELAVSSRLRPACKAHLFPRLLIPAPTSWPWLGWPPIGPWQPCDKGEPEPPSPECSPTCGRCGRVVLFRSVIAGLQSGLLGSRGSASHGPVPLAGRSVPKPGARTSCPFVKSHTILSYHPTSSLIQGCVLNWRRYLRPVTPWKGP